MRTVVLLLLGVHLANAVTHSMKYILTGVSEVDSFPEYTAVGTVDDIPFVYFDSKIKRMIPKTEWIKENVGADYWDRESQRESGGVPVFKNNIQIAMQRFNQTAGVHTYQQMYGCEWDDETEESKGFDEDGYDGGDFTTLDYKEFRYISSMPQGLQTAEKWNREGVPQYYKQYLSAECIEWLKKYLQYGKSSLGKTVSPQVSLLQKSSSSSVTCHATGFYPSGVTISWMKNGQDHHEDVEVGELLPNEDGTFQKTSTLRVTPDEWKKNKFSCVVEHKGKSVTEDEIMTNEKGSVPIGIIVGVVVAVLLIVIAVAGYMMYQKKKGFKPVSASDDGSNSSAHTDPRA